MPLRTNLYGLDREALGATLASYAEPAFRTEQVYRWLYARQAFDIDEWTDLPRELRSRLGRDVTVEPGRLGHRAVAADGTVKYRVELARGGAVEAVYMRQPATPRPTGSR